ncbi:Uncharacterized protein TCAP_06359 [Tolypocladium capitatum]|uniref:Uncharacterized protein n=1 Tax=Tolypocladium capitatum TaxID=45235 RepID=A0A2K3Q839_9HYPO|nr:Uncharacterized protein TCAP_06359 [Tolypocladium capitatum]
MVYKNCLVALVLSLTAAAVGVPNGVPIDERQSYIGSLCNSNNGVCEYTSTCRNLGGISVRNHCPGPSDVQCCESVLCNNGQGLCQYTGYFCDGIYLSEKCPGSSDYKCCVEGPNSGP